MCLHLQSDEFHTYFLLPPQPEIPLPLKVVKSSRVRLFAIPWTVTYPLSMGFSRQEYWSGLPFPSPGDLPHPGIEPVSPSLQADALPSEPPGKSDSQLKCSSPWKVPFPYKLHKPFLLLSSSLSYNFAFCFVLFCNLLNKFSHIQIQLSS